MTAVFWDNEGVILGNVMVRGETVYSDAYISTLKELMEAFQTISSSQESGRNLASAWQCQATHKLEDLGSYYSLWLDSITLFTLFQWSSTLSPLQGCLEPWRRLSATWRLKTVIWLVHLELSYMNRTKCGRQKIHINTHTHLSSLAQCWKSGGRVCKNVGMQSNHQSSFCVIFII